MPPKRATRTHTSLRGVHQQPRRGHTSGTATELMDQLQPLIKQAVADAVAKALPPPDIPIVNDDDSDTEITFPGATSLKQQGEDGVNPLHLHVSSTTIAKIHANSYVVLSELIDDNEKDVSLNISNNGNVTVNNKTKSIKITSIEQWFSAFLIYSAIYAERYPTSSAHLFIYMSRVQGIAKSFGIEAAIQYDESFRRLRERQPDCRWDVIHQEMYLIAASKSAMNKTLSRTNNQPQTFRRNNPCPTGYCRQFNAKGQCAWPQCLYKHACFKCEGKHASTTCKVVQSTERTPRAAITKSPPDTNQRN